MLSTFLARRRAPHVAAALLLFAPLLARAQGPAPLTLRDALAAAAPGAFANRLADGSADAARAQALLPTLQVDAGAIRTTDPIGAFGTLLRQRAVTPQAFDPQRLNFPAAIDNLTGAVVLQQPLLNADAWLARRAATRAARAADAGADWTRHGTSVDVIRAYYGAVLAGERVRVLEQAVTAARAHVRQADAMVTNGLATRSDALLAEVRAGELEADLAAARGGARTAARQLAVAIGQDGRTARTPASPLPSASRLRALLADDTLDLAAAAPRADVEAARLGLDAARADQRRALATWLPRLNAIGRYDWNSAARPFAGRHNWTVGVMASWLPFAGGADVGEARLAAARLTGARAGAEAAQAQARLQAEETRLALIVALERLAIAEHAAHQSAEAHRIVGRKYAGGLATIAELLAAQATETQQVVGLAVARYDAITAAARRRQATGRDPATLATLDDAAVATGDASTTPEGTR